MGCEICGKEPTYRLYQRGKIFCKEHFVEFFAGRVEDTIEKFSLFSRKDRIMVAVSGGKDSLVLLKVLRDLGYDVCAFHINLGIGEYSDISSRKFLDFVENERIPYTMVDVKSIMGAGIADIAKKVKRPACSVCGTIKRYLMDRYSKGYVVATGHNLDDEVSFLFMNLFNWSLGYIKRQSPVLPEEHGFSRKVKPLSFIYEYETALYAFVNGIDYVLDECPLARGATTLDIKKALNTIECRIPDFKIRFFETFINLKDKIKVEDKGDGELELKPCVRCGYPTTTGVCLFCRIMEKVSNHPRG